MLKRISKNNALTLTELLVSSVLMAIVMVGIAGFSATLKRMYDTTDKQTILAIQAATAVAHIERNLFLAIGQKETNATCLACATCDCRRTNCVNTAYQYCTANPTTYWSFRTDPNSTPSDYADDQWAIIFKPNNGANQYDLYACSQPVGISPNQGPDPDNGPQSCGLDKIVLISDRVQSIAISQVVNSSPSVLDFYMAVSITTSFNPASTVDDPFDDPAYTISTRIPLPSHSWN